MGYSVYLIEADASALQAKIDTALGWPKVGKGACQAVHVGGGVHVDHPLCCTTHHCAVIKHPTLSQWAVSIDDTSRPVAGTVLEVSLTADWLPTLETSEIK